MRKIKNAVYTDDKRITIPMLIIAAFMLIITFVDIRFNFAKDSSAIYFIIGKTFVINEINLSSILSIIPLSWGVSIILLMKTKKEAFAKMPSYIICSILALGFILYFIGSGGGVLDNLLIIMLIILAAYPFIIATLTIEGRVYNRVFATIFTSILITLTFVGILLGQIIIKEISLLYLLFLPLMYVELLLIVFCFRLEKISKKSDDGVEYSSIV